MSGSNPFRPKKPENAFAPPNPSLPSYSTTSLSSSSKPPAVTFPSMSFRPVPRTPPASLTPDLDDAASSDDQSVSDPFHQPSYATDEDGEEDEQQDVDDLNPRRTYQAAQPPPGGDDRSQPSIRTPSRSPSTDVSRPSDLRPGPASRAGSGLPSSVEINSRPPASRPGNRDRIPPPPPKSHHGKRIAPSPGTTPALTQTTPGKSTSRFSFHGTPSEPSYSRRPSQSGSDYFSAQPRDEPAPPQPSESLRRSQSQNKRPPTPPLSRRHSQMRRSKTTASKVNPLRLSIHAAQESTAESSPPPSPGSWSLNPSRTRESRTGSTPSEEPTDSATSSLRPESSAAAAPSSPTEALPSTPGPSTKRASLYNPLPPPPPPRRSRGSSNHSNDSSGLSLRSGKPLDEAPTAPVPAPAPAPTEVEFIPHPSNANDILADLTRLQKEVDDLRGHYESRKASQ
ncbi:uncharacterized protein BO80DRAFT_343989 [Aspergillus ibericus CBS 121593]|uniref:Uncharacterized protein n=1 Tax=Aspergillus ibericus CBS 121593 TaxID=1448316 RepID=A0A395HHC1_9EURO|nr:hypothetical protein BO80DRAFT_343989 [Aspergillus ibericus CBS 121593]RAL06368.1 hypothetical protein BO80DRAFT_343989 [Aspergillus ibericus CBS 121593]